MVRVLILFLTISLGISYLAARAYQQNKLALAWMQHVNLQASLQRAQSAWLETLDAWLLMPKISPEDCYQSPCLLEMQPVESFVHESIEFWEQTPLAIQQEDANTGTTVYAIVEGLFQEEQGELLRATFVALNEQGMQLRSQLVAKQNFGQVSIRYVH